MFWEKQAAELRVLFGRCPVPRVMFWCRILLYQPERHGRGHCLRSYGFHPASDFLILQNQAVGTFSSSLLAALTLAKKGH
jgi:hypothetical protein